MSEPSSELLDWRARIQADGLMSVLPELIQGPSLTVCERLVQLMRYSYWQDKNLSLAIRLGWLG